MRGSLWFQTEALQHIVTITIMTFMVPDNTSFRNRFCGISHHHTQQTPLQEFVSRDKKAEKDTKPAPSINGSRRYLICGTTEAQTLDKCQALAQRANELRVGLPSSSWSLQMNILSMSETMSYELQKTAEICTR